MQWAIFLDLWLFNELLKFRYVWFSFLFGFQYELLLDDLREELMFPAAHSRKRFQSWKELDDERNFNCVFHL